jgi:branched-chain amino acid transport system ATP-binding protein
MSGASDQQPVGSVPTTPALEIAGLEVQYGGISAVKGISLSVAPGEIVALVGANGAGKTTTLRAALGLVRPSAGVISVFGKDVTQVPTHQLARLGVALVPEGRAIFSNMSVQENLELGAYSLRDSTEEQRRMQQCLTLFPRLKERLAQIAGTLSGGEQQMLAIGRALMSHPKLLLLDEPSLGLAPQVIALILKIVQQINQAGTTVLLVEQNAHLALKIAHKGVVLETGEISLVDEAANLLNNPKIREAYLGH